MSRNPGSDAGRRWSPIMVVGLALAGCSDGGTPAGDLGRSDDGRLDQSGVTDSASPDRKPPSLDRGLEAATPADARPPDTRPLVGLPYPTRTAYRIKGLQPDYWANRNEVIGNNTGGIAVNLVWSLWEPGVKSAPCAASEQTYDGRCFKVDAAVDAEIKAYTAAGVVVTGVLYGVPAWARTGKVCSPVTAGFEIFCTPNVPADYGRFAGMIASRYNGAGGKGRVADFVIHNEVNSNDWFDIGCGQGIPCDQTKWLDEYAASYKAAYDRIVAVQSAAKVLISLEHHFAIPDAPAASNPLLSGRTFLKGFATRVSPRAWRLAFHSYPPSLLDSRFSPEDYPKVTFGNLGVLVAWLRQEFPATPSAWEVQLTENGINSLPPSSLQKQASPVCDAFRNVLGTPGIESFIYHRMRDHSDETAAGLGLGLRNPDGSAKPAWSTWALANRADLSPPKLSCGFEDLPYTRLTRSFKLGRGHWTSSRLPPEGFTKESSWKLLREAASGTKLLYECKWDLHNSITDQLSCGGKQNLGPVGYVYQTAVTGSVPLHACTAGPNLDHFVSPDSNCEGQGAGVLLGHARP